MLMVTGRNVLRASLLREDVEVVAINHTCASVDDVVYLIEHDSTHGPLATVKHSGPPFQVSALLNGDISINGRRIALLSQRDVRQINWGLYGAETVAECTGKFTKTTLAKDHIEYGAAKKVIISAPSADAPAFVFKVNSAEYSAQNKPDVVSCASCTTNCVAPIVKVINDSFGLDQGFVTTVHASTRSQSVLDGYSKRDRRSGRAVLGNIIPTTTGAAKAIAHVLPALSGKLTGISIRVPTTNVSLVDLTVNTDKPTSLPELLEAFRQASRTSLSGVLGVVDEELVSCDFLGNSCSAVIDALACVELNSKFFKVVAWYDNEWAYPNRLLDLLSYIFQVDQAQ
ncbi:hypothetical protein W97_06417 [Coniosporium apollinis CBS 100218]|uniref:Glyceraldehyde 3-phosphate dehydrogenase NAD(P) binding domain-containing protein n=1 Tax=Coniosporium apollinis (strain CBS 100218) TaxID=1168221 RepID=R7YZG0_CONA1|nr:uncharacterized protein W97_06417 [Coniosporium apollinis CBS 100218]EON67164.1 hypothetical protein W97_06417 [Coniosporium apollinis CBS 100218]